MTYRIGLGTYYEEVYFLINKKIPGNSMNTLYDTSKNIAKLFCMELDEYNDMIVNKIIGSTEHTIRHSQISEESDIYKDLMFKMKKSKQFYIDKFEEVFAPQLMLLAIEG